MRLLTATVIALTALSLTACTDNDGRAPGDRLNVVAGFYPVEYLVGRIGGDRVQVTSLTNPGVEPHDLELKPRQVAAVADADLVVYVAGFQPAVDEAVAGQAADRALDVTAGEKLIDGPQGADPGGSHDDDHDGGGQDGDHDGGDRDGAAGHEKADAQDRHVWLDPTRYAAIANRVADRLAALDKPHAAAYRERAAALAADLTALDGEFTAGLATCQRRDVVTSHAAFGYLAARYRLTQVPISGLSPDADPTPARVAEVAALARSKGVTTIFFETLVSPRIAETLAREVGARAEVLDPLEGLQQGSKADYFSVMRQNLGKLRAALSCQ